MESLVGISVTSQDRDWTCIHCGSLTEVRISCDDEHSQQWLCGNCHGKTDIQKLSETEQAGYRGSHGPIRNEHWNGVVIGCCKQAH